jgi:hypothetical protein
LVFSKSARGLPLELMTLARLFHECRFLIITLIYKHLYPMHLEYGRAAPLPKREIAALRCRSAHKKSFTIHTLVANVA